MATVTEYLERSMQNCSLSNRRRSVGDELGMTDEHIPLSDTFLDLNSHISIPSHLEKCLDLKTGEVYYRNWNNGMKVKEDPRKSNNVDQFSGESYGSVFSEENSSYYETEESSTESSPSSRENRKEEEDVLVVAGCKACFMYFMVPKLLESCPKCASQLLHFDQPHYA
ncbi:Protein CURLY FLAG LEAF 2 [Cardamine amara subsp. amara]|uniref:Protein CURLY FLAG LEAF 2 n=1 Tax=Cardamine amara subsp. amara TaxID=228776 RepID=A0ABD1BND6_CARAN